jgi:hypothetical protein
MANRSSAIIRTNPGADNSGGWRVLQFVEETEDMEGL